MIELFTFSFISNMLKEKLSIVGNNLLSFASTFRCSSLWLAWDQKPNTIITLSRNLWELTWDFHLLWMQQLYLILVLKNKENCKFFLICVCLLIIYIYIGLITIYPPVVWLKFKLSIRGLTKSGPFCYKVANCRVILLSFLIFLYPV